MRSYGGMELKSYLVKESEVPETSGGLGNVRLFYIYVKKVMK